MDQNFNNLRIISGSEVEPREVEWLWYPYIPYGKVTIIQGDPGEGKSTFVLNLAAMLTTGTTLPSSAGIQSESPAGDFVGESEPINVIYQNTEDDLEDTVIPRFIKAGGDRSRVFFIDESDAALSFADKRIGETIRRTGAKLIIFDPLTSYIGEDISINLANEVRSRMNYLIDVAKATGCAIIIVGHMNKMSGAKALYRSLGSIDVVGSARSCLLIGSSPDDPSKRIMAVQKCNLAEKGKAIEFSIDSGKVSFLRQVDVTADELVNAFSSAGKRTNTKLEKAKEVLVCMLTDGPKLQRDVMAEMTALGISKRTAADAKGELGVVSRKIKDAWIWELPEKL